MLLTQLLLLLLLLTATTFFPFKSSTFPFSSQPSKPSCLLNNPLEIACSALETFSSPNVKNSVRACERASQNLPEPTHPAILTRLPGNLLVTRILDLARPKVLLNSSKSNFCKSMFLAATSLLFKIRVLTSNYKRFIVTSGEIPMRSYQVVVAATRDMGIGKDGKLPWRLPSDLKFFKEITLGTTDPVKQNAVLMGRKTWESIPIRYRPLPGRLNVVLTRSFEIKNEENVVTCGSISSALEILAKAPYCLSIDKVFVIGGGQILRETLNGPRCDAIHITRIETSVECDTFIPSIDFSMFQPWYSSPLLVENGIRYSFVTYVHVRNSEDGTIARKTEGKCNDVKSNSNRFEVENFSFLPKMIFEKRDKYMHH